MEREFVKHRTNDASAINFDNMKVEAGNFEESYSSSEMDEFHATAFMQEDSFATSSEMTVEPSNKTEPVTIYECDYSKTKCYLLIPQNQSHSDDQPQKFRKNVARSHKCSTCESFFRTYSEQNRHIKYKHSFDKPHKCPVCDYASVEVCKLKRHMCTHSDKSVEKAFKCPLCDYSSALANSLKRHLVVHTGEKPFACNVCSQRFTQSCSLKLHKAIHSGTQPVFQCELCSLSCSRRADLKRHKRHIHGA